MIVEKITDLIGNTPLLKLPPEFTQLENIDLYAKLEFFNPFGSVKDRVAWAIIKEDLENIKANKQTVFENSTGNTAKALAVICGMHGIPFKKVSALVKLKESRDILHLLNAELEEFAAASDCFDPSDPNDPQFLIERAVRDSGGKAYFTSQFTNEKNPQIHEQTTAQEILADLGDVDYLIGGLGTTGSTLGLIRAFKKVNKTVKAIGVITENNTTVPGIRSLDRMWQSGLFEEGSYEHYHVVSEKESLEYMLELNRKLGLLCGPSSGANYAGAIAYLKTIDETLTERKKAVFIACDRMEWYLSYIKERMPEVFGEEERENSLYNFEITERNKAETIKAENLSNWIKENNPTVVDVRSPIAFSLFNIEGSFNIPIDLFKGLIENSLPFPQNKPVLLVCAVGEKTPLYASYLQSKGYKAYNLEGGISAFKAAQSIKVAA